MKNVRLQHLMYTFHKVKDCFVCIIHNKIMLTVTFVERLAKRITYTFYNADVLDNSG